MRGIRVGIGGWSYEPWRKTFYPPEVKAAQELEYASRQVTAIEINSTFYRLQKPAVYAKWRDATPDDFMFCIKAPRFLVQRKSFADIAPSLARFIESGIEELGAKLGPLLWQLDPSHAFDADDLRALLEALPKKVGKCPLRHALNVRHESFRDERFIALAREFEIAIVLEDDDKHPAIADVTSGFIYARLRRSKSSQPTGYSPPDIRSWTKRAQQWSQGKEPDDLPRVGKSDRSSKSRDVFVFFINGAKERAPAAARAMIAELAKLDSDQLLVASD